MAVIRYRVAWFNIEESEWVRDPVWNNMLCYARQKTVPFVRFLKQAMEDILAEYSATIYEELDSDDTYVDFPDLESFVQWRLTWL